MNEGEQRALAALAWMAEQYLTSGDELDSQFMRAGERALEVLERNGLVTIATGGRCGRWTEAGREFLLAN